MESIKNALKLPNDDCITYMLPAFSAFNGTKVQQEEQLGKENMTTHYRIHYLEKNLTILPLIFTCDIKDM